MSSWSRAAVGKPGSGPSPNLLSSQSCPTLQSYGLWPSMFLCPWDSPGKNTGVGCHTLQRILPGIKPVSPVSCFGRWVLYHLESPVNRSGNLVLNNKPAPNWWLKITTSHCSSGKIVVFHASRVTWGILLTWPRISESSWAHSGLGHPLTGAWSGVTTAADIALIPHPPGSGSDLGSRWRQGSRQRCEAAS